MAKRIKHRAVNSELQLRFSLKEKRASDSKMGRSSEGNLPTKLFRGELQFSFGALILCRRSTVDHSATYELLLLFLSVSALNVLMSSDEPSINALTDIWLTPSIDGAESSLNKCSVLRVDRGQTPLGGGEALYIKSSLNPVCLQLDI